MEFFGTSDYGQEHAHMLFQHLYFLLGIRKGLTQNTDFFRKTTATLGYWCCVCINYSFLNIRGLHFSFSVIRDNLDEPLFKMPFCPNNHRLSHLFKLLCCDSQVTVSFHRHGCVIPFLCRRSLTKDRYYYGKKRTYIQRPPAGHRPASG